MSKGITQDEWLQALEEAQAAVGSAEGMTMREIAEAWGLSEGVAQVRVKNLHMQGLVEFAGRRRTMRVDGAMSWTPVYRVVVREKKKHSTQSAQRGRRKGPQRQA